MKGKIHCNTTYICGLCGNAYDTVYDRMNCEAACHKKQAEEAKAAEEAKKKAEQAARKAEVDAAFLELHRLMTAYVKDYGHYEYVDCDEETNFNWPSRIWHKFW